MQDTEFTLASDPDQRFNAGGPEDIDGNISPPKLAPVTVVVSSVKGSGVIRECLDAVQASEYPSIEIVVVNNGSTDGTKRIVETEYPNALMTSQLLPVSHANGLNDGIKLSRGEFILFLADDAVIEPEAIGELVRTFERIPEAGIVGCKVLFPGGRTVQSAGGRIRANGAMEHDGYGEPDSERYGGRRECDFASDCACAMRVCLFEDLGLFDDAYYPAFFEEAEFAARARRRGWQCLVAAEARVCRRETPPAGLEPAATVHFRHRSRLRYVLKNFDAFQMLNFIGAEFGNLFKLHEPGEFFALMKAYLYTLAYLPPILYDRFFKIVELPPLSHTFVPGEPAPPDEGEMLE